MTDSQFRRKLKELQETINRLIERQKNGWYYKRVLRKGHKVKSYTISDHYVMTPMKRL